MPGVALLGWPRLLPLALSAALVLHGVTAAFAEPVSWDVDASGLWSDPTWDPHAPTANDVVMIDQPSSITVTHAAGTTSILGLTLAEKLIINGGSSLTTGDPALGGDLLLGDGSTLQVDDAFSAFTYQGAAGGGTATIDGAILRANNGGRINLGEATSYVQLTHGLTTGTRLIQADGTDSHIDLSGLTNLDAKNASFTKIHVFALNGGSIDIASLPTFDTGAVKFKADGAGSQIDLSALSSFLAEQPFSEKANLVATGGGTLLTGSLTDVDRVDIRTDATAAMDVTQINSYQNGQARFLGGTHSFTSLTVADNSNFIAEGAGTSVAMNALTSSTNTRFEARGGGVFEATGLTTLTTGNVLADGLNSVVDVGALTTFTSTNDNSQIKAINGGEVKMGALTTLDRVKLIIDGTGIVPTAQITDLTDGRIEVSGGTPPDFSSLTNIDGSDLVVSGGASLTVPATSWADPGDPSFSERVFEARDANSVLDLSTITSITPSAGAFSNLSVNAKGGGFVDLSGFTTYGGKVIKVLADGSGSQVDLAGLQQIVGSENFTSLSQFRVTSGGHINMPSLTDIDRVDLVFQDSGTMDTDQIVSYTHATITADGFNVSPSFSGIVTTTPEDRGINGASLVARNGAKILIPHVTRYKDFSDSFFFNTRKFEADGVGSLIDLSGLQELQSGTGAFAELQVNALGGGQVDLSGLNMPSPQSGVVKFKAVGPTSTIDLSSLSTFTPAQERSFVDNSFEVSNGGTILIPGLTSLEYVDITTDGTGSIDTAQMIEYLRGTFKVTGGASPDLSGLQTIDGASFVVQNGQVLNVSNAVNYDDTVSGAFADRLLQADGPGSFLDLSGLTLLEHTNAAFSVLRIEALDGGVVDMSAVTTFNSGAAQILADGNNSLVDLSAMTTFAPQEVFGERSGITATNNGVVKLGAAPPPLPNVDIEVSNGGMIMVDDFTLDGGATLTGDGTWGGSLTVADGTVSPGNSPGEFRVSADYHHGVDGTLSLEIEGTGSGAFDVLSVDGSASLDGAVTVSLLAGYTPQLGHSFEVITAGSGVSGKFATVSGVDLGNNLGLAVTYESNRVLATVANLGDADLDNDIDTLDIGAAAGNFTGAGGSGGHWKNADFDGDGDVDTLDIGTTVGNFTGPQEQDSLLAIEALDPNRADLIYDPLTGNVQLDASEAAGGIITVFTLINDVDGFNAPGVATFPAGGLVDDTDSQIGWADPLGGFAGIHDLGDILPTGLNSAELNSFLMTGATYTGELGSGANLQLDLRLVPEPGTWALLAVGGLCLIAVAARRRRAGRR